MKARLRRHIASEAEPHHGDALMIDPGHLGEVVEHRLVQADWCPAPAASAPHSRFPGMSSDSMPMPWGSRHV